MQVTQLTADNAMAHCPAVKSRPMRIFKENTTI